MNKSLFRIRIRPDLASCICPGFPWIGKEIYAKRRAMLNERILYSSKNPDWMFG